MQNNNIFISSHRYTYLHLYSDWTVIRVLIDRFDYVWETKRQFEEIDDLLTFLNCLSQRYIHETFTFWLKKISTVVNLRKHQSRIKCVSYLMWSNHNRRFARVSHYWIRYRISIENVNMNAAIKKSHKFNHHSIHYKIGMTKYSWFGLTFVHFELYSSLLSGVVFFTRPKIVIKINKYAAVHIVA